MNLDTTSPEPSHCSDPIYRVECSGEEVLAEADAIRQYLAYWVRLQIHFFNSIMASRDE
jgi:hypothetical protein